MAFKFMEKLGFGDKNKIEILSPIEGVTCSLEEVNDPIFQQKILGDGIAIKPENGRVVAPVNGTIAVLFNTKHAISIISEDGVELLIHVGLDTVNLKGEQYKAHVSVGDMVKAGDLLLEFDIEGIQSKGYDLITPVIVCNTAKYSEVVPHIGNSVRALDKLITLKN